MPIARFFTNKNQQYRNLKDRLRYVTDGNSTFGHVYGKGIQIDEAYRSMRITKYLFGKNSGRLFIHFCVSYEICTGLTPKLAHEIGSKIANYWNGFQVAMGTHLNTSHLHNHFIINTVNVDDGKKFQQSKRDMEVFKVFVNEIFKSYNLRPVINFYEADFEDDDLYNNLEENDLDIIEEIIENECLVIEYPSDEEWNSMDVEQQIAFAELLSPYMPYVNTVEYSKYKDYLFHSNMPESDRISHAENLFNIMNAEGCFDDVQQDFERYCIQQAIYDEDCKKSFFYKNK